MTLQAIIIGVFALLLGIGFTFYGFKFFLILLPIWGFFVGFIVGANVVTQIFGDGFLSTVTSWVIGFLVAVLFAALSYLYYWVAVILLGGSIGYMAGMGLMAWLNNGGGLLAFTVAIIFAIVVAVAFVVLHMPLILAIVGTAIAGASAAVVGLALALGRIPLEALQNGTAGAYVADSLSWLWIALAIVLAVAGAWYQTRSIVTTVDRIEEAQYRNPGLPAT